MLVKFPPSRLRTLIAGLLTAAVQSRGDTLVVPNASESVQAPGGGSSMPFFPNQRYQLIYGSDQFNVAAGDIIRIHEIRFRIDDNNIDFQFSTVAQGLSIFMATTTKTLSTASRLFANNPETPLFEALPTTNLPMSGSRFSSTSFDVVIPLPNAYEYDRRVGNLLVDMRSVGGAGVPFLDFQGFLPETTFAIAGFLDSNLGDKGFGGWVTRFEYQVVPEPSSFVLVLFGGASVLTLAAKRRKTFHTQCEAHRRD
jgi:hypothetical protein